MRTMLVIREIIAHCARRFSPQDGEDFSQTVMVRLIEEDYRILREFKGRSSLRTYLATAIKRMLLDYQNHLWGKWHPSAEAKRLGPTAVWLERLRYRDKLSFEEACRVILGEDPEVSRANLEIFEAKISARIPRHFVGEEHLESEADPKLRPDERLEAKELAGLSRRVLGILLFCINLLDPEERTLLWLKPGVLSRRDCPGAEGRPEASLSPTGEDLLEAGKEARAARGPAAGH